MADKRRRDDEDEDDLGLRTPVKKPTTKKVERPEKVEKKAPPEKKADKRPARAEEPEEPVAKAPPKKEPSGKRKALEPRPAAGAPRSKAPLLFVGGLVVAAGVGGVLLLLFSKEPEPERFAVVNELPPEATPKGGAPRVEVRPDVPSRIEVPPLTVQSPAATPQTELTAPAVTSGPPVPQSDKLEELRRRSANHEAIARLLEEYAALTKLDPLNADDRLFEDFRRREQREAELIAELQRLGAAIVPALSEMLLELDSRAHQIFLAKALAGIDGPEALQAVEQALARTKDVALQTTLVRFLPETPDAAGAISRAFTREENPNLRGMLLREYSRRLGEQDDSGRDLFTQAALSDPDPNVRAEAVTIIGRRGDPRDQQLMEKIIAEEQNLPIKQRAIVSYAETGKDQSLPYLEGLARDPNASLPVRASAVLAIGRVGGERAIQSLDLLAQSDPDQEIRRRAQMLAASLRAQQQAAREGTAPEEVETSIGPDGQPLNR